MSVKRRDRKNRILRDEETQCKDGKYRFTFYEYEKQKCFYSWRLERTVPLLQGKRECIALRDKEEKLRRSKDRGLAYQGDGMTVLELVDKYTLQKWGVKHTTQAGYRTVLNILKKDAFGAKRID